MLFRSEPLSISSFSHSRLSEDLNLELAYPEDVDMNTEVMIDSIDTQGVNKGKRKSSAADLLDDRPSKARTLGGDRVRESVPIRELAAPPAAQLGSSAASDWSTTRNLAGRLPWPSLLTYLKVSVEGLEDILEGRNSEDGGMSASLSCRLPHSYEIYPIAPSEVIYVSGKQTQWLDYLSSPALGLAATTTFSAVAMQDGSVNIYSPNGRR